MANIDVYLAQILAATYGEEVRGSIHDSIAEINRISELAVDAAEGYRDSAKYYAELVETFSTNPPYIGPNGNWWVWNVPQEQYVDSGVDASIEVDIADVTMLAEGAEPYVTNTGTNTDPIFHLFIPRGNTGNGIASVEKTGRDGLKDTYTITYTDGETETFDIYNGKGITSISKTGTSGLDDTYTIAYNDTSTSTFTVRNGNGIRSIAKTDTTGLVDTYTGTYTDGTTFEFEVHNGKGITSITKTGTSALVDTYTIAFNDGTSFTYTVTNGRSVVKIEMTDRTGLVDTYTITFNDGTTFDYTVTNGADGTGSVSSVNDVLPVGGNIELKPSDLDITEATATAILAATDWVNKRYSFETTYPSAQYNLKVYLDEANASDQQRQEYSKIRVGYYSTNVLVCEGDAPSVNIPVILIIRSILT